MKIRGRGFDPRLNLEFFSLLEHLFPWALCLLAFLTRLEKSKLGPIALEKVKATIFFHWIADQWENWLFLSTKVRSNLWLSTVPNFLTFLLDFFFKIRTLTAEMCFLCSLVTVFGAYHQERAKMWGYFVFQHQRTGSKLICTLRYPDEKKIREKWIHWRFFSTFTFGSRLPKLYLLPFKTFML